ncbi:Acetylornithine deacetylase [Nocardiopsis sp. JB363]|nr:Acetylornithine deacetylase [Nocardiopsis sp. JB363]
MRATGASRDRPGGERRLRLGADPGRPAEHRHQRFGSSHRGRGRTNRQGYVLPEGTDAENALRWAHETVFEDELRTFTTPGYLDGRVYALYKGIPALVHGPISEAIHGYDERVDIESVRRITKSIALFIAQWCGLTEVS